MSIRFQIMVLAFIRDWYQVQAANQVGEMRKFLNERAEVYQKVFDEMLAGANGGGQ